MKNKSSDKLFSTCLMCAKYKPNKLLSSEQILQLGAKYMVFRLWILVRDGKQKNNKVARMKGINVTILSPQNRGLFVPVGGWGGGTRVPCPKLTKDSKNESVSEMSVQGKFDQIASDPKSSCGLYQRHENPPTDGSIKNSQWDAGDELLSARV